MSQAPSYQFISSPYPREGDAPDLNIPSIETIVNIYDRDVTLTDIIASFQDFLVASGYELGINETLGVILDE